MRSAAMTLTRKLEAITDRIDVATMKRLLQARNSAIDQHLSEIAAVSKGDPHATKNTRPLHAGWSTARH